MEAVEESHEIEYVIDGSPRTVRVAGASEWGQDTVLLKQGEDLIERTGWADQGFFVAPFLERDTMARMRDGMTALVRELMAEAGVPTDEAFTLDRYHDYAGDDERHANVVARFRKCLPMSRFPIDARLVCDRIGELSEEHLEVGSLNGVSLFCLRIIRPGSRDQNPLHRDGWLPHLRRCLNLYAPLGGSTVLSSLGVVPGSHRWSEAETCRTTGGAQVDGAVFTVPTVAATKRPIRVERPNPGPDEVLVFSPFLLHGGAPNLEEDVTRVSLELRLVRRVLVSP